MATLKTTDVSNVRESLDNIITNISPDETPFVSSIKKTSATATKDEWLVRDLRPANKDNAAVEGADAPAANTAGPTRQSNYTQIFTNEISVSGTLQAVKTAGTDDDAAYYVAEGIRELKTDIEAAMISNNASVAVGARKLGGAESFISTNALHGANGVSTGYSGGNVNAPTDGTTRALTETLFNQMIQKAWDYNGKPSMVLASGDQVVKIGAFNGNGQKMQAADKQTVYGVVKTYVTPFGTVDVVPSRYIRSRTIICYDPSLWQQAVLRSLEKNELAKTGDSKKFQLVTEVTLRSRNEKGNSKLADLT